jgi:hypothetical protein
MEHVRHGRDSRSTMVVADSTGAARAFQVDAGDWHSYFETLAMDGDGLVARVTLSPERPEGGDGAVAWPLHAIRYDSDADEIQIHVGRRPPHGALLRYFVSAPRAIHVHEQALGKLIAVEDMSGVRTLIQVAHARAPGALRCRLAALDHLET